MIIEIDGKIVPSELFTAKFLCDLDHCMGACCIDGDDGAPLLDEEIKIIEDLLPKIKPYMTPEGIEKIEKDGVSHIDDFGEPVTNLVEGGACAFVTYDEKGIAKCSIESAYRDGKINWKKPLSCELFPIRIKKYEEFDALNYEQIPICEPGRTLGEKVGLPLFKFLKEPLIRAYGEEFYKQLEVVHKEIENENLTEE